MKTIDLNFVINNLEGKPLKEGDKEITAGNLLAGSLAQHDKDPIKFFDWAQKLYNGETITIDNADFNKLKSFIEDKAPLRNLAKGPILRYLEEVKEEQK